MNTCYLDIIFNNLMENIVDIEINTLLKINKKG